VVMAQICPNLALLKRVVAPGLPTAISGWHRLCARL
jgi:hypothetical protein